MSHETNQHISSLFISAWTIEEICNKSFWKNVRLGKDLLEK